MTTQEIAGTLWHVTALVARSAQDRERGRVQVAEGQERYARKLLRKVLAAPNASERAQDQATELLDELSSRPEPSDVSEQRKGAHWRSGYNAARRGYGKFTGTLTGEARRSYLEGFEAGRSETG